MTDTRTLQVGWYNVEFGHRVPQHMQLVLEVFENLHLDVLGLEEFNDYTASFIKLIEPLGHRLVHEGTFSRNAILVRKGIKVTSKTVPDGKGFGTWLTDDKPPKEQHAASPICALIEGIWFSAVHLPVHAFVAQPKGPRTFTGPKNRLTAYANEAEWAVSFFKKVDPAPVFMMGDWNCDPNVKATYSPDWIRTQVGGTFARPGKSTGHGEIDFAITRGLTVTNVKVHKNPIDVAKSDLSDHLLVTATVTVPASTTAPEVPVTTTPAPKTPTVTAPRSRKMDPSIYKVGAYGAAITWLGQRLVAHGYGSFYKTGPGPRFTATDKKAVAAFQRAQGWTGTDANGLPGHETLKRLAAVPAKKAAPKPVPAPAEAGAPAKAIAKIQAAIKDHTNIGTGMCQKNAHDVYGIGGGFASAYLAWLGAKYKHTDLATAPDGAFVYFDGGKTLVQGKPAGHVAIKYGNQILTPGGPKDGDHWYATTIAELEKGWPWHHYVGWTEDINGVRVAGLAPKTSKPTTKTATKTVAAAPVKITVAPVTPLLPAYPPKRVLNVIDTSRYQGGNFNLAAAKHAGVEGWFHKATEGHTLKDPLYKKRRRQAKKAGLPFGAYHFAYPTVGGAEAEARWFLKVANPKPGDLRAVLDLEKNPHTMTRAELTTWVATWCRIVTEATGVAPIVYTNQDLDTAPAGTLLWVARYTNGFLPPVIRKPWKRAVLWQHSNGVYGPVTSVPGIGHCDVSALQPSVSIKDLLIPTPATAAKAA